MSWDNVSDIKNIKIWTDYSDSTQGHLFVNDHHQLKLSVGISFTLKSGTTEGPTEDEVQNALSLINNQDSGPLKYLSVVEKGNYTAVYDPYYASADLSNDTDDVDEGIYDFVFSYYVTSRSSINAEAHAETVALKLAYTVTNADGTTKEVVKETSAKGNYYTKTFVSVLCYPSMLYGNPSENRISFKIVSTEMDPDDYHHTEVNYTYSGIKFYYEPLTIAHSYFKIYRLDGARTIPDDPCRPVYIGNTQDSVMWDYIYNAYFPNMSVGEMEYTVYAPLRANPRYDDYYQIVTEEVTVHQNDNEIAFLFAYADVKQTKYLENLSQYQHLIIYDQFGNNAYVVVNYTNADGSTIASVS